MRPGSTTLVGSSVGLISGVSDTSRPGVGVLVDSRCSVGLNVGLAGGLVGGRSVLDGTMTGVSVGTAVWVTGGGVSE